MVLTLSARLLMQEILKKTELVFFPMSLAFLPLCNWSQLDQQCLVLWI